MRCLLFVSRPSFIVNSLRDCPYFCAVLKCGSSDSLPGFGLDVYCLHLSVAAALLRNHDFLSRWPNAWLELWRLADEALDQSSRLPRHADRKRGKQRVEGLIRQFLDPM